MLERMRTAILVMASVFLGIMRKVFPYYKETTSFFYVSMKTNRLKADSLIAWGVHAVPMQFPFHAEPLSCSDSAVFFVKVRVEAGNIRTVVQQFKRLFLYCAVTTLYSRRYGSL
jgi:hypothetical protein